VAKGWIEQNITLAPSPLTMIFGLGVPLLIALPGIYHALRDFEQDGDQLVLMWLLAILVVVYLPTNIQRRFTVGLMIPIAYFGTRALDNFWFPRVSRVWRYRLLVAVIPVMTISHIFPLLSNIPLSSDAVPPIGPFLERDYAAVFQWLKENTQPDDVILAVSDVSIWIPGWVGARVVYGHPFETMDADVKDAQVLKWYQGEDAAICRALLNEYQVKYVIVGPEEKKLGTTRCVDDLTPVIAHDSVIVYAP
jgi:hypothetical protein